MSGMRALAAFVVLTLPAASSARPTVGGDGMQRLDRYDVLVFADPAGGGIDRSKAIGVFDATPDEVFRTVTDYERLAEFAPRVVLSHVIDRSGDERAMVSLAADLPWPVSRAWVQADFQTEKLGGGVYRVRFAQVRGSMRRYFGSLLIEPWSDNKTAVTYEVVAEPVTIAPRSLVNRKLRDAAARYVHALRQRVNDLHKLGRLHPELPPSPSAGSPLAGPREPKIVDEVARTTRPTP
jgi:ribosome-associated toxin RatA of RatAB toxin-antitoxin module